jgi:hypothetical protein
MVCLFSNEKCRSELIGKVKDFIASDEWEENCLSLTNWNYLKSYMNKKIEPANYAGKKIPSRFVFNIYLYFMRQEDKVDVKNI